MRILISFAINNHLGRLHLVLKSKRLPSSQFFEKAPLIGIFRKGSPHREVRSQGLGVSVTGFRVIGLG